MSKPLIVRVATVPVSLKILLHGQMKFMSQNGLQVIMMSAGGKEVSEAVANENCPHLVVPMARQPNPLLDLISLVILVYRFVALRPSIVHSHTPKAGLLAMLAGWIARVPIRIHTVAGLPWMESRGIVYRILRFTERLTFMFSHQVWVNSPRLREFLVHDGIGQAEKLRVIGSGSSNGIDSEYFTRIPDVVKTAEELKKQLEIEPDDFIFLFVGRIVRDKGVNEMLSAFNSLSNQADHLKLILVGSMENHLDPISPQSHRILECNSRVIQAGFQDDVRPYLALSDVLVFPSYREGFPNVPMQAGCFDLPVIATDINGCNEIIQEGINGLLIPPKNVEKLHEAMERLARDMQLRHRMGSVARKVVMERFEQRRIWEEILMNYEKLLTARGVNLNSKRG